MRAPLVLMLGIFVLWLAATGKLGRVINVIDPVAMPSTSSPIVGGGAGVNK